ncbi:unnamed protein product [Lupinus luteus]|uniref:Uncharacterized protein n=1 Tax=Lupinus luteus TaxID=3873 RepID=A0AAV1WCS4_LUPLU
MSPQGSTVDSAQVMEPTLIRSARGTSAMATFSKFGPSSNSPDRPLCTGQRGSHIAAALDRSGSSRESMEYPILSSLPNMSRSYSSATHGDVSSFFKYVHFDQKLTVPEHHKSNRQMDYKQHVCAALGILPDESYPSSSKGKLLPSPVPEDIKRLKDSLHASQVKAR